MLQKQGRKPQLFLKETKSMQWKLKEEEKEEEDEKKEKKEEEKKEERKIRIRWAIILFNHFTCWLEGLWVASPFLTLVP